MAEKTEKPTGKRLNEARTKGNVAVSRDLTGSFVFLMSLILLNSFGGKLLEAIQQSLRTTLTSLPTIETPTVESLRFLFFNQMIPVLPYMAIIMVGLLLTSIIVTLLQTKANWASKRVGLDFSKVQLNPLAFFKRIFSPTGMVEILKSFLKLLLVGWIVYIYLQSNIQQVIGLASMGIQYAFFAWSKLAYDLGMRVAITYFILGIADFGFQWWQNNQSIKMTKDEVKDERTQQEGNPTIRSALRTKQMQMSMRRMMASVPQANVVITNPTHLAIAIEFKSGMRAPIVLAKGARLIAEKIIEIAKANDIPIVQNIPLAHALYQMVEIEKEIPPELYTAMAEVLIYIYKLRGELNKLSPHGAHS